MDYFHKTDKNEHEELLWNIPEQKQGTVNIIGGNSQNFRTPTKVAEFLSSTYPIKTTNLVLPDALKTKLPPLPNFVFLSSTDTGSLANTDELTATINHADFSLLIGDFSKNSITAAAVHDACKNAKKPTLLTRDTLDLITPHLTESTLMNENLIFLSSMPQLIKLLRAVYYPKVLLLSQSLVQVADALHKFTLSYPAQIITLHSDQILIAKNGNVIAVPIASTTFTPLSFWFGEAAASIVAINLFNPNNFLNATTAILTAKTTK